MYLHTNNPDRLKLYCKTIQIIYNVNIIIMKQKLPRWVLEGAVVVA